MTKLATAEAVFAEPVTSGALSAAAPWLDERRVRALETVRLRGVPHRRVEDWKYSDLKSALDAANDFEIGKIGWSVDPVPSSLELFDLAAIATAPEWVRDHLGKSAGDTAVPAASLAFAQSGFALRVSRNAVPHPIRVKLFGSGHARALVVLEEGAKLTLIESPATGGFSNLGMELIVGPNAHLTIVRLADAAPGSIQVEDVAVHVARDGAFHAHLVNGGATLARLNLRVALRDAGANAHFSGVSVLGEALHADITTEIHHASGKTQSTQLFKKAVGGKARAVYQGKIIVAAGANGSDSRQTAKAILLSERAEADLKPELEILADDVKCAHGAAIGDLDADSLFYLRSRGVPEKEARNLLIRAFLEDAVLPIADERIRGAAWDMVESALARATERVS
jgi:Fe-S cluster assembly protein SufD